MVIVRDRWKVWMLLGKGSAVELNAGELSKLATASASNAGAQQLEIRIKHECTEDQVREVVRQFLTTGARDASVREWKIENRAALERAIAAALEYLRESLRRRNGKLLLEDLSDLEEVALPLLAIAKRGNGPDEELAYDPYLREMMSSLDRLHDDRLALVSALLLAAGESHGKHTGGVLDVHVAAMVAAMQLAREWEQLDPAKYVDRSDAYLFWSGMTFESGIHGALASESKLRQMLSDAWATRIYPPDPNSLQERDSYAKSALLSSFVRGFLAGQDETLPGYATTLWPARDGRLEMARCSYYAYLDHALRKGPHVERWDDSWSDLFLESMLDDQSWQPSDRGSFGGEHPVTTTALVTLALEIRLQELAAPR